MHLDQILSAAEKISLSKALTEITSSQDGQVLVRSSAYDEDLESRGKYESRPCESSLPTLLEAVAGIFADCVEHSPRSMCLIVQQCLDNPSASGHLSNERRVAERRDSWLFEYPTHPFGGTQIGKKIRAKSSTSTDARATLNCRSPKQMETALRTVANWAYKQGKRWHFEWVRDNKRLWIVQADEAPESKGQGAHSVFDCSAARPITNDMSCLVDEKDIPCGQWPKIDNPKTFRKACDFPVRLWVLQDPCVLEGLCKNEFDENLIADLGVLLESPIVIRSDVHRDSADSHLNLPRSDTLRTIDEAKAWLVEQAPFVRNLGNEYCFFLIVRRYVIRQISPRSVPDWRNLERHMISLELK